MSSADWTALTGILDAPDCARGVTSGPAKPNGGGTFVYGVNSLTNTVGVVALHCNQTNFSPTAALKGGDIRGALVRALSGGPAGWSAWMMAGLQNTGVGDTAYLLGLSDGNPSHIELRKGAVSGGLPDEAPGGVNKILRRSTAVIPVDTWVHLRLEWVVNTNGDVILNCFQNDLTAHAVGSPVWTAIPGMDPFTDDALQVATGSAPLTAGRFGFGARVAEVTRRAYFDHIEVARQA